VWGEFGVGLLSLSLTESGADDGPGSGSDMFKSGSVALEVERLEFIDLVGRRVREATCSCQSSR